MAHPLIHPRLPGGHNLPDVTRDIGADEYVGPLRRVEFGVLPDTAPDPAYTVVSAFPLGVLTDAANTVLDDPDDPNDSPSANPGITLVVGQRYEFVVNDATNDPIALVATGTQQGQSDNVLFAMNRHFVAIDSEGLPFADEEERTGQLENDPAYEAVRWTEEGEVLPDGIVPPEGTAIGGRISFLMTAELRDALTANGREPRYATTGAVPKEGVVDIVTPSETEIPAEVTMFSYWWQNF